MTSNETPPLGQGLAHHAFRLSGRIVAGVGQVLLWLLNGLGRLLRPLAARVGSWLYGRQSGRAGAPAASAAPGTTPYGSGEPQRGPQGTRYVRPMPGPGPATASTAPLPRWIKAWKEFAGSWWFAPLTGVALTLAALTELYARGASPISLAGGFAVAATVPLVWRREFLRPVAAVALGAFAAAMLSGQLLLFTVALAALYTLYTLGQHLPRQAAGVLVVSVLIGVLAVYLASNSLNEIPWPVAVVAVIAAIGLGDAQRVVETAERTEAAAQERTTETLTRLNVAQREQAVLRERARIARELHDVVAHSVSMIAVQAETAPYTVRDISPEAALGYQEIARTAREALVEMRRLLSVLRTDAGGEAEVAPQPRLDRLPDLVEKHRGAGGQAEISVQGDPRELSATIELSAYRIVQESLTNARRHAPGSTVKVELIYLPDRLALRVRDNGQDATMVLDPRNPGGGHGLLGMRERATMLGGRFSAGPAAEGGFMVEAELPFRSEEHPRP